MLWPAEHLHETYEHIRNDALGSGCSVVIYVALDCDALCAVKILTSLLKADNVAYKLRPVRGYSDILEDFRETSKAEAIKSIIMINCGGDVNAQEMFNLDDGMTCYIIDSARPYNHANLLRSHMHTIVFADDFMKEEDLVKEAELLEHLDEDNVDELLGSNDNDDDDDDDDDDDSNDGKGEVEDGNDANSARNGQEGEIDSDEEHEFDGGNPQQNASDSDDDENEDANKQTSNNTNNKTSKAKSASQLLTEQEEAEIERELAAENGTRKKRRRTSSSSSSSQNDKNNDSGDDDDDDDDDDDNDDDSLPKRKVREKVDAEEPMDDKARVAKYYAGSFRGTSAAHVLFSLSQRLNKDQKIFLWLAIVGTTHHFINSELSEEDYLLRVLTYQDLVKDRSMSRRAGQHTVTEDGAEVPLMEGQSMEFIEELRLMLHRHWSLHEAFLYSDYIAAKLGIWKNDGEAKLRTFFAKMGISRKEAEQKYSFMNMSVKRALKDKIGAHGADFSLDESFVYASFQFRAGFGHQLSAADTAYCMAALLESAATHPTVFADDSGADATEDATEIPEVDLDGDDLDYAGEDGANGQKENSKAILAASLWKQSFNAAYDALSFSQTTRNQHLLEQGLNLAKALQKAIIQEGGNIISGTKIASAGSFRYCILEGLPPKLVSIFSQPDTLLRLAKFIMLAYTSAGKWSGLGAKPLVLGVKNLKTNKAHFVGLPHPTFGDDAIAKNPFGRYFRVAAQKVGTAHIHVGFSSACIEIPLELVQKFLVALHEITA